MSKGNSKYRPRDFVKCLKMGNGYPSELDRLRDSEESSVRRLSRKLESRGMSSENEEVRVAYWLMRRDLERWASKRNDDEEVVVSRSYYMA